MRSQQVRPCTRSILGLTSRAPRRAHLTIVAAVVTTAVASLLAVALLRLAVALRRLPVALPVAWLRLPVAWLRLPVARLRLSIARLVVTNTTVLHGHSGASHQQWRGRQSLDRACGGPT